MLGMAVKDVVDVALTLPVVATNVSGASGDAVTVSVQLMLPCAVELVGEHE